MHCIPLSFPSMSLSFSYALLQCTTVPSHMLIASLPALYIHLTAACSLMLFTALHSPRCSMFSYAFHCTTFPSLQHVLLCFSLYYIPLTAACSLMLFTALHFLHTSAYSIFMPFTVLHSPATHFILVPITYLAAYLSYPSNFYPMAHSFLSSLSHH